MAHHTKIHNFPGPPNVVTEEIECQHKHSLKESKRPRTHKLIKTETKCEKL